ncbi:MAG: hypothetical protein ABSG40_23400 [Terriglobales bacterium]
MNSAPPDCSVIASTTVPTGRPQERSVLPRSDLAQCTVALARHRDRDLGAPLRAGVPGRIE